MRTTRPEISETFLWELRQWVLWLNSGASPMPRGYQLAGIERNAKSAGEREFRGEEMDEKVGVTVNDAFHKLRFSLRHVLRIHLLWSAANPIDGPNPREDWASAREREAKRAAMPEDTYEKLLEEALCELEKKIAV